MEASFFFPTQKYLTLIYSPLFLLSKKCANHFYSETTNRKWTVIMNKTYLSNSYHVVNRALPSFQGESLIISLTVSLIFIRFKSAKREIITIRQHTIMCWWTHKSHYTNSLAKLDFAINSVEKETNWILSVCTKRLQEAEIYFAYMKIKLNTLH